MLTFNYRSGSSLPRRTFIVNVQVCESFDLIERQYEVTAPDQYFAQEIVRRWVDGNADVVTFWTYAIREVVKRRDGVTFIRPFMLEGKSIRFPYFNGSI